jgi:hypothetical protein
MRDVGTDFHLKTALKFRTLNVMRVLDRRSRMRKLMATITLLILICSQSMAAELKKLPLDDASSIGLRIQTDTAVKAEGKGSIKITTSWPATVCLGEVNGLDIEDTKLVYAAKVKSDIDEAVFLEMWAHVAAGSIFQKA